MIDLNPHPPKKVVQPPVNPRENVPAPNPNVHPQNNPFGSRPEEVPLRSAPVESRDNSLFGGHGSNNYCTHIFTIIDVMRPGAIHTNPNTQSAQNVYRPPENSGLYPQANPIQGARPPSNTENRPAGNDPLGKFNI